MINLQLLGGVAVSSADPSSDTAIPRRRALALLSLVAAAAPQAVARDKILAVLWPESDTARARNSLRQSIFALRRDLHEDIFLPEAAGALQLDPAHLRVDLWEFRDAIARNAPADAVAVHRGPFLDGFHVPGLSAFGQWIDGERDRIERQHIAAIDQLGRCAAEQGRYEEAVMWRRRQTEADPLSSKAALALLEALVAAGDRPGAFRYAASHERLIRQELEIEPDPAVTEFIASLRRDGAMLDSMRATPSDSRAWAATPMAATPISVAAIPPTPIAAASITETLPQPLPEALRKPLPQVPVGAATVTDAWRGSVFTPAESTSSEFRGVDWASLTPVSVTPVSATPVSVTPVSATSLSVTPVSMASGSVRPRKWNFKRRWAAVGGAMLLVGTVVAAKWVSTGRGETAGDIPPIIILRSGGEPVAGRDPANRLVACHGPACPAGELPQDAFVVAANMAYPAPAAGSNYIGPVADATTKDSPGYACCTVATFETTFRLPPDAISATISVSARGDNRVGVAINDVPFGTQSDSLDPANYGEATRFTRTFAPDPSGTNRLRVTLWDGGGALGLQYVGTVTYETAPRPRKDEATTPK